MHFAFDNFIHRFFNFKKIAKITIEAAPSSPMNERQTRIDFTNL
jgi:hypothetical protein